MRLKKDINPKGTRHTVTMLSGNIPTDATYKVTHVAGIESHTPGDNDPEVYLELAGKTGKPVQHFVNMPLSVFVHRFRPVAAGDVFFENEKILAA